VSRSGVASTGLDSTEGLQKSLFWAVLAGLWEVLPFLAG
jgi:hypothetical protein